MGEDPPNAHQAREGHSSLAHARKILGKESAGVGYREAEEGAGAIVIEAYIWWALSTLFAAVMVWMATGSHIWGLAIPAISWAIHNAVMHAYIEGRARYDKDRSR